METKKVDYGTKHEVKIISSSIKMVVGVGKETKEAYIMLNHGLNPLPKDGDEGYIIFEKNSKSGYWQYYPSIKVS